jgi:hypothetical protein
VTELHIDLAEVAARLREQREQAERARLAALGRLRARAEHDQDIADILTLLEAP